jgi:hypothetical protein
VLRLLAQCLGLGARKCGRGNWQGRPIENNLSPAMKDINELRTGDVSEAHLVNSIACLAFTLSLAVDASDKIRTYVHHQMAI